MQSEVAAWQRMEPGPAKQDRLVTMLQELRDTTNRLMHCPLESSDGEEEIERQGAGVRRSCHGAAGADVSRRAAKNQYYHDLYSTAAAQSRQESRQGATATVVTKQPVRTPCIL